MKYIAFYLLLFGAAIGYCQTPLSYTFTIPYKADNSFEALVNRWNTEVFKGKAVLSQAQKNAPFAGSCTVPYISNVFTAKEATSGEITFEITVAKVDAGAECTLKNFRHKGTAAGKLPAYNFGLITTDRGQPYKIEKTWGVSWEQDVWRDIRNTIYSFLPAELQATEKQLDADYALQQQANPTPKVKQEPAVVTGLVAPNADSLIVYSEVVQAPGFTESALFYTATQWLLYSIRDYGSLNFADKSEGILIASAAIPYSSRVFLGYAVTSGRVTFTITIRIKEGKYKYTISDFKHHGSGAFLNQVYFPPFSLGKVTLHSCPQVSKYKLSWGKQWECKVWNDVKEDIQTTIPNLADLLKLHMLTATPPPADEEW